MIICGHSYKKRFKYLSKLKQGDYVIFTDVLNNQYIYEVEETLVLPQTSVDEMINNDFENKTLLLIVKYNNLVE